LQIAEAYRPRLLDYVELIAVLAAANALLYRVDFLAKTELTGIGWIGDTPRSKG
jgi:hypothetical protein